MGFIELHSSARVGVMDETRASASFFSSTRVGFAHNIRERSSTNTDPRPDRRGLMRARGAAV